MSPGARSGAVLGGWLLVAAASAGQAPGSGGGADIPISHHDRVYAAEQFSNTVSVSDPVDNRLLGVIRLGDPSPGNLSPLYRGQLLVHGMGYSPDHHTLAAVAVGSNSVSFIDTETNLVKHTTYVGRSPHEAFYTPDGKEVWVTVRGENYVSILDASTFQETARVLTPNGPGMQIFSPDGKYGYVCSSFTPDTVVIDVSLHEIVGHVEQDSPFCPNIAATPDGNQVWMTLKDSGRVMVFDARPPFQVIRSFKTGPITNHVNFAATRSGLYAYVTVGGLNEVKVFRTDDFTLVKTIAVGALPHGIWPSGDGSRMYVGLENADRFTVIETSSNTVTASFGIGQAPQAVVYVPGAVQGSGTAGLTSLGVAGKVAQLSLVPTGTATRATSQAPTSVSLFDQGLIQVIEVAVTDLPANRAYALALSGRADGSGVLQPLTTFTTNSAGAAVVNAIGPIRQVVQTSGKASRRYLVIAEDANGIVGKVAQVQARAQSTARMGVRALTDTQPHPIAGAQPIGQ